MRGAGLGEGARCLYGSRSHVTERRDWRFSRLRWNDVAREVAGLRALSGIGVAPRAAAPSSRRAEKRSKAGAVVPPGGGVCGWVCCRADDNGVLWHGGESGLLAPDYGAADRRVSAVRRTGGSFTRLAGSGNLRAASSEEPGPLRADCVSAAWVVYCGQADHYGVSVRLAGVVARHSRFVACPSWLSHVSVLTASRPVQSEATAYAVWSCPLGCACRQGRGASVNTSHAGDCGRV